MARNPKFIAARTTFQSAGDQSGIITNTFVFNFVGGPNPTLADWTNLVGMIKAFYNAPISGHPQPLGYYLGPQLYRGANATETALYELDLADPHHYFGSPVHVEMWTLHASAGNGPLPNEVACVFSFRGPYGSDPEHSGTTRPRASDRGRIYFGPLDTTCLTTTATPAGTTFAQFTPEVPNSLRAAGQAMFTTGGTDLWAWSVWSRKEQALKPVVDVAADNNTDSQRRRSLSTALQTWIALT